MDRDMAETKKTSRSVMSVLSQITLNQVLVVILIVASFLLGSLWSKVQYLEEGGSNGAQNVVADPNAPNAPAAPAEDTSPREVSLDDDPVLGDPDAPVTLVEFSDYECPFCKSYFTDTYPQIKEQYIDTGKVKVVFRDYPLSFHDPLATTQAVAANCARAQGDDATYFTFHDEVFTRTSSNGSGMTEETLTTIATEMGLDVAQFNNCLADESNKEEITKDIEYANTVGVSATPSFFVGKSEGGDTITGTPLIGAQPFSAFQAVIDPLLE